MPNRLNTDTAHRRDTQRFRRRLLAWYRRAHRDLPWRAAPGAAADPSHRRADPYHVLVSEAMLQQTQVATVIDYFHRFIARFPTVEALAAAPEQEVLALWQGLGYYRRARHLHAAAKRIVDQHRGRVPETREALEQLPGIGRYAAGAIASIAHGRREAVVDGNVARVLARVFAIDQPIDDRQTIAHIWRLAARLVPPTHPGDFNQALMELGATVCTPRAPQCLICPLSPLCRANQQCRTTELPRRLPRKQPISVTHHILAVTRNGNLLLRQRPAKGLWSNMWELPTLELAPGSSNATPAVLAEWLTEQHGLTTSPPEHIATFTHQTTHRTIQFVLWQCDSKAGRLKPKSGAWRRPDNLDGLPLPNPQRKAIALLAAQASSPVVGGRK